MQAERDRYRDEYEAMRDMAAEQGEKLRRVLQTLAAVLKQEGGTIVVKRDTIVGLDPRAYVVEEEEGEFGRGGIRLVLREPRQ